MSEEYLVRYCSPTLAGLKTGNMFSCKCGSEYELYGFLRKWNISLKEKGIRLVPLKYSEGKALVYIYRPERLSRDLSDDIAAKILTEKGYCTSNREKCLINLKKRMRNSVEFPHEVGFFLGYPPEDVRGFIEKGSGNCKCVGNWKVYGNTETAKKTFEKYKKCSRIYKTHWENGKSIEKLTVAVQI